MSSQNNNLPEGFKMTEVGPLPEEWEVMSLGRVAEVKYGKANPKDSGQIPLIGSGGIFLNTSIPLVNYPTIVIGRKGTAGKVWFCPFPCYPSDTTFYLQWKHDINVAFIFYFMTLNPLSGEHAKTTLPSLQKPYLENMVISLPPLPEQKAIARVLSTIQKAIETQNKIIAAASTGVPNALPLYNRLGWQPPPLASGGSSIGYALEIKYSCLVYPLDFTAGCLDYRFRIFNHFQLLYTAKSTLNNR